ncbi:MAG: O-methyltransferase [Vicinamibacterales bacterium]
MLRSLTQRLTAGLLDRVDRHRKAVQLAAEARALQRDCASDDRLESLVDLVLASARFRPSQKRAEILGLLEIVQASGARTICEIGAAKGGTLALLAHAVPSATRILSIDIRYNRAKRKAYPRLVRAGQRVTCVNASSYDPGTLANVRRWLGGERLDFIFIDGDHSLDGVSRDFEAYWPLVREGGIIAVHDIVPDYRTRYGRETDSNTGEVPLFWRQLKPHGLEMRELIENPDQDGYGIGVMWKRAETPPALPATSAV